MKDEGGTLESMASPKIFPEVTLLSEHPSVDAQEQVLSMQTDEDRLVFVNRSLFWLPCAGLLDSALDHKAVHRLLGQGTTRTLGTLQGIAKKLR